jgi:phosphoglycerate dehydrogenase-like enzyme
LKAGHTLEQFVPPGTTSPISISHSEELKPIMPEQVPFRVGLSADFLNEQHKLIFPDFGLELLEKEPRISFDFIKDYKGEYSPDQLGSYDVVISLKPRVTAASLASVDRLCAIGRAGVGYDNIDLKACTEADVALYITPQAVVRPMAESIVLFILALSHHLVLKDSMVRKGQWRESTRRMGREPRDRVLGSIGLGGIGTEVVRLMRPFDVGAFLAYDPYLDPAKASSLGVEMVSLEDLLHHSDYVLVNCPLTPETRHLVGAQQLALMKRDAVLVNAARGSIVDEAALIHALQTGVIAGAALDVMEHEPLDSASPLLTMGNVIVTSHSIGWTEELFRDIGRADCTGALAIFQGQAPASVVNKDVLKRPGFLRKLERHKSAAR